MEPHDPLDVPTPASAGPGTGAKRPYEASSSESVVSFAADSVAGSYTQGSVSASVANSVLGPDGKRPPKASSLSSAGCRQRVTVVCAECKRLKLKCDRRTPCGSCTKRDTVPRCIYSQAAAEKVDVQSLNIRLSAVEGKLNGFIPSSSDATMSGAAPSTSASMLASRKGTSGTRPRAFLAVGNHGASVSVNLEGVTGLWIDHMGLNTSAMISRTTPVTITELELEGFTTRNESGIELRPFPSVPEEGIVNFIVEQAELFRMPASLVFPSMTGEDPDTAAAVNGAGGEHIRDNDQATNDAREGLEDDGDSDQIGVTPKLIMHTLPSANIRAEIYKRFEAIHWMSPCVNFFEFKNRIEEMCRWAEAELGKSGDVEVGKRSEPHPTTATPITTGTGSTTAFVPTLNFFGAAALGLAFGAQCWLLERDRYAGTVTTEGGSYSSPGPSKSIPGSASGAGTSTYDLSMPPPPPPAASALENNSNNSPTSPSGPGPSTSQAHTEFIPHIDPSVPSMLYRLGKLSLSLSLERAGYGAFDTDYIHAKCLQARYLLVSNHGLGDGVVNPLRLGVGRRKRAERKGQRKGTAAEEGEGDAVMGDVYTVSDFQPSSGPAPLNSRGKGKERASALRQGPTLALAPEMVGVVSDAVGNARMMGLNHDPEFTSGGKLSVYDIEMRRRLWWEIVRLDAFVADCLGESPFINDDRATTEFPSDVDEESFGPDSANRPAPNIESHNGNIDFFIQRCRLVDLGKRLKRKAAAFNELRHDANPSETYDLLEVMKSEISAWVENLSDYLRLKGSSANLDTRLLSPSTKRSSASPAAERDNATEEESLLLLVMRSVLAMEARHLFLTLCLRLTKDNTGTNQRETMRAKMKAGTGGFSTDGFAPSTRRLISLEMLEPALYIVQVWRYAHATMKHVRPTLFMCYACLVFLFDAAVVLGHLAIEYPGFAGRALAGLRVAAEVIRDPSVLAGRSSLGENGSGSVTNEAVRIIEQLLLKSEAAAANLSLGGGLGPMTMDTPPISKRKHEEVDTEGSDLLYHFRFPFVGTGVVSAGPPINAAMTPSVASPLADNVSIAAPKGAGSRSKHHGAADSAPAGDPRPATTKHKASHPTVTVRNRKSKESSTRARANSSASQRSDASRMPPPAKPPSTGPSNTHSNPNPPSTHSLPISGAHNHNQTHNMGSHRLPSIEPPSTLINAPFPGPLSSTPGPGPGPSHYVSPPGTSSGGGSSQQPPRSSGNGGDFGTGGFHDAGSFPGPFGPPFAPQSGPTLPVPSHVQFDGFGFGTANGMHQPAGYDPLPGLPRPPSEPSEDRQFSRNAGVDSRAHGPGPEPQIVPHPPMQPLDHQPQPHTPQSYHPHSHSQVHAESMVSDQGWSQNTTVYPSWPYYQG